MHPKPSSETPRHQVAKDELEKLLTLAESLIDKQDATQLHIASLRLVEILLAATFLMALVALIALMIIPHSTSTTSTTTLLGTLSMGCGLYAIVTEVFIRRQQGRAERDRLAAGEVVGILREVEAAVKSNWSPLEQAEFRIRLSRFGISGASADRSGIQQMQLTSEEPAHAGTVGSGRPFLNASSVADELGRMNLRIAELERVVESFRHDTAPSGSLDEAIIDLFDTAHVLTLPDAVAITGAEPRRVVSAFSELVEKGLIARIDDEHYISTSGGDIRSPSINDPSSKQPSLAAQ